MRTLMSGVTSRHVSWGATCALAATLYWGLWPSWTVVQSAQRQVKATQAEVSKAQAEAVELQQRFERRPVDVTTVSATLARLIELTHISPQRYGVTVSQVTPVGAGRSSTGTVAMERLIQTDGPTGLNTLSLQIKGKYTALDGLYSFIDALGPDSGMAVQSFEAAADQFVLTLQAYATPDR